MVSNKLSKRLERMMDVYWKEGGREGLRWQEGWVDGWVGEESSRYK